MSKAGFAAFVSGREERFEFVGGFPVMMTRVSRNHSIVTANLIEALLLSVDRSRFRVSSADFGVEIGEDMRFPDALVEPVGAPGGAYAANNPVFVAEVLSPSSVRNDLFDKRDAYGRVLSIIDYLVLSQDHPVVWLFTRDAAGRFPQTPAEITGRTGAVTLAGLAVSLPLADLYRSIGDAP
jgi:Uma2 family endonuclease